MLCPQAQASWDDVNKDVHRAKQTGPTIAYVRRLAQVTETRKEERRAMAIRKARDDIGADYYVDGILGEGGYGVVFAALHRKTGRRVAVKRVSPFEHSLLAVRTLRELRLLRFFREKTTCENIIGLLDVVIPGECASFQEVYLVQENMDSDLYRVLRSQPLSYDHAQYFTYQTLRGLKPIHDAGVLHRDIKPSNLLVNANCDLKVCDFGLARSIGAGPPNSGDHMLTEYVATRWYRAPEIMLSSRQYTKAVDIWSIGCTVYEMLCGEPLFPGKDYHHQLSLILDVLGTPSFEALRPTCAPRALEYVMNMPPCKPRAWSTLLPDVGAEALDFLARTVTINPADRMTVDECLAHPFVAPYHDPEDEPSAPRLDPGLFYFDFQPPSTGSQVYRQDLWNDGQAFAVPGLRNRM
ncbi:mitogen-activated protein kinase [Malassezia furfur]|uniref:Mitogen-activated protein kinase n=1 Tax=Malassezia furfur TaxID=55194 RepID=A0ABY8ER82_MALFU|nr:hypothetical protein CBS14141_002440 [Malassezia furfur]WFD48101.1 mitogen-activated protein kinase [Malassezia furfur]